MKSQKTFIIKNESGMHARPSASFVKKANEFKSNIFVEKDGEMVNGKSIMGLLMLAAGSGQKIKVTAEGPDADMALLSIGSLIDNKFES